jgi:hypothetical protein
MRAHHLAALIVVVASLACTRPDRSITRGADGGPEWKRRLAAAVPLGIFGDSARSVMQWNDFRCQEGDDSVASIWCDKLSAKGIVRRRWQAVINLNAQRVVYEVRGSTGLIGP